MLRLGTVKGPGPVVVKYFTPKPIHVAEARVSAQKGYKILLVKLQDKSYQGSPCTLFYDDEQDALFGLYYHGKLHKTFEVGFLRRKP